MSVPKHFELFRPLLSSISDGAAYSMKEVKDRVVKLIHLSEEDQNVMLESGIRPLIIDRLGWAKTYLKQAGLITYPKRAFVKITQTGLEALSDESSLKTVKDLHQYPEFIDFIKRTNGKSNKNGETIEVATSDEVTPEEQIESAHKKMINALADEVLDAVLNITPHEFERLVVKLLLTMGYGKTCQDKSEATQASNDGGIDGVVYEDKLGFNVIYIQAKQWSPKNSIGRPDLQKFIGALTGHSGATKGLFITTSSFSQNAIKFALEEQRLAKIVLIDGQQLAKLMIEHDLGVTTENTYEIKRLDSDFFNH